MWGSVEVGNAQMPWDEASGSVQLRLRPPPIPPPNPPRTPLKPPSSPPPNPPPHLRQTPLLTRLIPLTLHQHSALCLSPPSSSAPASAYASAPLRPTLLRPPPLTPLRPRHPHSAPPPSLRPRHPHSASAPSPRTRPPPSAARTPPHPAPLRLAPPLSYPLPSHPP
ncbi:hypothetical protein KP509_1Z120800 [Ceratopteris richardii]|nr:hypothetical protein KP509_1Z120800 [Ceratopteris richardii]